MAPMFSVVIPTYNQADYLRMALQSVLEQTYQDYEVIVVNNFSTDHTLDVIQQIKDPRVQAIDYRNRGIIGAGRNVGIRASQGSYIAFLDSDDTWYPKKLERVAEAISADPQVGLVCHDQDIFRDGKVAKCSRYGPPEHYRDSLHNYLMFVGNCVSTSATVVAKQYLDEVGYFSEDQHLITVEDFDLWVRLSRVCRFKFIHQVLGRQHYHSGSSSANAELHLRSGLAILEKHRKELEQGGQPYPKGAIRLRCAKTYFTAARQYQRRGAVGRSLAYYGRTLRTYPFYATTYAGLALLFVDLLVGKAIRKRITDAIAPGI